MLPRPRVKIGNVEGSYWLRTWRPHMYTPFAYAIKQTPYAFVAKIILCIFYSVISCDKDHIQMPLPQQQVPFPRQPLRQPHPIQPRPPQQRAAQPHPHQPHPA